MCGIAGIIGSADEKTLGRMVDALRHRGPDDRGTKCFPEHKAALGHCRLSIIDLSAAGHQPMSCPDGRVWITYNGEVYNYRELRRELEGKGHAFRTQTDTEVVLAAYVEWGEECLPRLRGMFAFAVLDLRRGEPRVFLARDRFGIKPLYYAETSRGLVFASEVRAFLASGLVERRADRQAVWDYLSLGSVPQSGTILAQVKALPAAHAMRVDAAGRVVRTWRYWNLAESAGREPIPVVTLDDAARNLRARLEEATRLHMIADVPVGAFFSGGMDSTAVVALMNRIGGKPVRTFTVRFADLGPGRDEGDWARRAAAAVGAEHHEVAVTATDVAAHWDRIIEALDQPSIDGVNTFFVSKAAAGAVTVALSGCGGDELFAGYPHFESYRRAAGRATRVPAGLTARDVTGRLPAAVRRRLLPLLAPAERLHAVRSLASEAQKRHLLSGEFLAGWAPRNSAARFESMVRPGLDPVAQMSYAEVSSYLADTLLRDTDAMSMAHSLEVRPVLLDHVLAEFAFALPAELKLDRGVGKLVLRRAVRDLLPDEVQTRPKVGFEFPFHSWLAGALRERLRDTLAGQAAKAVFRSGWLTRCARPPRSDRDAGEAWRTLILLGWLERTRCDL
ncbi:MAG: asparagine synthase (glutamine-hydrolyzing) [Lentisphaerae bacterium RIFOXYB12_FULL_65_16]|nr:MAG: asparagine synthase (glutamine-hydrolyzing) [Lentisphaerae bacterium RIFOXYA12_64_32]OGV87220.1 MAG: asparagine synthase (glutamine-hydrolyzing) [Lentisphaerae bacterium RIFOXYB12_FULL_65_16]